MTTETVTIELDQMTAALLRAKAAAEGLSLADYLRHFAEDMNGLAPPLSIHFSLTQLPHPDDTHWFNLSRHS